MRSRLLSSVTALLAGTGVALAQAPGVPVQSRPVAAPAQAGMPSASPAAVPNSYAPAGPAVTYGAVPGPSATVVGSPGDALVVGGDTPGEMAPQVDLDTATPVPTRLYVRPEYLLWELPVPTQPPLQTTVPASQSGIPSFNSTFQFPQSISSMPPGGLTGATPPGAGGTTTPAGGTSSGGRSTTSTSTTGSGPSGESEPDTFGVSGGRLTLGYWIDPGCWALEVNAFDFERKTNAQAAAPTEDLALNFNTTTQIVTVGGTVVTQTTLITLPMELQTTISTVDTVKEFWGGEANVRCKQCYIGPFSWDFLAGVRTVQFGEDFDMSQNLRILVGSFIVQPAGAAPNLAQLAPFNNLLFQSMSFDHISVRNHFYGGQVGVSFEWCICPRVSVTGFGKLALGGMSEITDITGSMTNQPFGVNFTPIVIGPPTTGGVATQGPAGVAATTPGGLLTPGIGAFHQSVEKVAWVPEGNITLGYWAFSWMRAYIGLDVLYLSQVARPGSQISFAQGTSNLTILGNTQAITVQQPTFRNQSQDIHFEGLVAGLEFRF